MPRPRVRPEDRVRSSRACDLCKTSKIRCNSRLPCATCIKRNRASECVFTASNNQARQWQQGSNASHASTSSTESPRVEFNSPRATGLVAQPMISEPPLVPHVAIESGTTSPKDSLMERFVTSTNGEKVYIGDSASLSFLDFLRRHLRPYVGATPFTDGELQHPMLENEVSQVASMGTDCTVDEETALLQCYSEATSGLLHVFTSTEVESFADARTDMTQEDLAAYDVAVAIGAQARANGICDAQNAAMYFAKAQATAFRGMLMQTSLGMDAAFLYLGVASKAAIVLGLHQPMSWKRLQKEDGPNLRLRIWHSLCILDVLTSSIIGRPCTVPRATRHDINALPLHPDQPAFNSILKGVALLDDVCRILSRGVVIDVATAEGLLQDFRHWSQSLPSCLRRFSITNDPLDSSGRESLFGRAYVSGIYYFSVILITRPFLIRHLMTKLRRYVQHGLTLNPEEAGLAQVCMNSAVYMGELCRKIVSSVATSGLPFGSMCLFKTWSFGAGLILGYSMFAGETGQEFQEAFNGVCKLLKRIGEANPQSRPYHETLEAFAENISAYRRQALHESRRMVDQYVDQILIIDSEKELLNLGAHSVASDNSANTPQMKQGSGSSLTLEESMSSSSGPIDNDWFVQQTWDDAQCWEGVSMQFLDSFAIESSARII